MNFGGIAWVSWWWSLKSSLSVSWYISEVCNCHSYGIHHPWLRLFTLTLSSAEKSMVTTKSRNGRSLDVGYTSTPEHTRIFALYLLHSREQKIVKSRSWMRASWLGKIYSLSQHVPSPSGSMMEQNIPHRNWKSERCGCPTATGSNHRRFPFDREHRRPNHGSAKSCTPLTKF